MWHWYAVPDALQTLTVEREAGMLCPCVYRASRLMRVAVLHNPRPAANPGRIDDAFEEYDDPVTIAAIAEALADIGLEAVPVVADEAYPWTLKHGRFDFVFNLAEGAGRRCREAFAGAICEFLGL